MKTLAATLVLAMALGALPAMAQTPSPRFEESLKKLSKEDQAVAKAAITRVAMLGPLRGCAGSLIAADLVLTAWHCVDDMRDPEVNFHGQTHKHDSFVVAYDADNDLAVLKLTRPSTLKPLAIAPATTPLKAGDPMLTIGHPLGNRDTVTAGTVIQPATDFFSFTAVVDRGNSGGPVLDRQGRIVGVTIILNQLIGDRGLGDAAATAPIQALVRRAEARRPVSWRAAKHTGYFDLGYGKDKLLDELTGVRAGALNYAIGLDLYDRWRVGFRHNTFRPDRVWGFETGPVFKTLWFAPALLVGRNYYFPQGDDVIANKWGVAFSVLFFDVTVFRVQRDDQSYTAFSIGF